MKKILLMLCCMVTVLYGADLFEHIDKAEKYLNSRYERGSAAHSAASMELMKIASSDKSDAEKIAALKKRFPEAFKLSEADVPSGADLFEHIDKAEKYLNSRYERLSAAHRAASMKLMEITSSGKSDAEKIAALKKRFPEAFKLSEAEKKYLAAAEKGDAEAQLFLGVCYHDGDGVEKDLKQAVYWYRKAADQGDASAQFFLGLCYYTGDGVEKDLKQAVYWWRKAANQGDAGAQAILGACYHDGVGVEKDHEQALFWLRKSAAQGNEKAIKVLKNLEQ